MELLANVGWVTTPLLGLAFYLLYSWLSYKYGYWQRRGVPSLRHKFLLGNMGPVVFQKTSLIENFQSLHQDFKQHKFGGYYEFLTPVFMAADPDLIREILIKDFDHFADRRSFTNEHTDPLFCRSLSNLKGADWKNMRNHLSPAFTASKLRGMFPLISRCGEQFARFLVTRPHDEPLEFKAAFTRLTNDVIASIAFGVESNAISNPEEEFYKHGLTFVEFKGLQLFITLGHALIPKLMTFLNIPVMPRKSTIYFDNTIKGGMQYREKNGVTRPDMLQLLMAARQKGGMERAHGDELDVNTVGEDEDAAALHRKYLATQDYARKVITDDDITSQAFNYYCAGFHTVSTMLSFTAHELAVNPDVQQRLREEIDAAILENDGKLTYDNVLGLKYFDMVISESLRKYPTLWCTDRQCTKNFTVPGTDVMIEKGTIFLTCIYALHRDPEYFPDPEKFDPERFNEENKKNIKPYTYLPFGAGPRYCIGMRFALLKVKLCLAYMLATCELRPCAKTEEPLKLSKKSVMINVDNGFWLSCVPREEPSIKLDTCS